GTSAKGKRGLRHQLGVRDAHRQLRTGNASHQLGARKPGRQQGDRGGQGNPEGNPSDKCWRNPGNQCLGEAGSKTPAGCQ
ncbi:hypothetical protein FQN60_006524, partial [Etheostoma spectabile]